MLISMGLSLQNLNRRITMLFVGGTQTAKLLAHILADSLRDAGGIVGVPARVGSGIRDAFYGTLAGFAIPY